MNLIFIAIIGAFFYFIDVYVFQGVKTFALSLESSAAQQFVIRAYWWLNNSFYVLALFALLTADRSKGMKTLQIVAFNAFITLIVPKLIIFGFLCVEDIIRFVQGIYNSLFHKELDVFFPERRAFISTLALSLIHI
jgi:hypothetical protein